MPSLALTPRGLLLFSRADDASQPQAALYRTLEGAFARGSGHRLLDLDQATDRVFRIGQTKNVLVHKFVCRGTVEERIDELIDSKRRLSEDLLEGSAEMVFTEMRDAELLKLVALDLHTASVE